MAALWPGRIIQKLPPACGDPLRNVSILERLKKSATLLDPTKLVPCFPGDGVGHHFDVVAPGGVVVHAIEARLVSMQELAVARQPQRLGGVRSAGGIVGLNEEHVAAYNHRRRRTNRG